MIRLAGFGAEVDIGEKDGSYAWHVVHSVDQMLQLHDMSCLRAWRALLSG